MASMLKSALLATAGMTLFSYIISVKRKEKFLEPLILNQLIYPEQKKEMKNNIAGYMVHYLAGLAFTPLYKVTVRRQSGSGKIFSSFIAGLVNGIAGIAVWNTVLKLHKNPPEIKVRRYYPHLLSAHIVFGLINGMTLSKEK